MGMLILLCGFALGALLFWSGWRGRRVGAAFHCRSCEFDLSGVYPGAERCPECGASLESYTAVVIGRYERRWRRVGAGVALAALSVGLGTLAARGVLSVDRVVSALSTRTLIAWSVERAESPIAWEGRRTLLRRVRAGRLSEGQQHALAAALEQALEKPAPATIHQFGLLMSELGASAMSEPEIRQQFASFLFARHQDDQQVWVSDWSSALDRLRQDGVIPDDQWERYLTDACIPRLWRMGEDPLRPGEEFVIGLDFRSTGVARLPGMNIVELVLPAGAVKEGDLVGHTVWEPGVISQGLPGSSGPLRGLIRAPEQPGVYEIAARVWYSATDGDLRRFGRERASAYPDTLVLESKLVIEVAQPAEPRTEPPESVADWLHAHVLPPYWDGSGSLATEYQGFGLRVPVAAAGGPFAATGEFVAIEPDGSRHHLGDFTASTFDGGESQSFSSFGGSSRGIGSGHGAGSPGIQLELDRRYAPPLSDASLVLVLRRVALPDGREHAGEIPLEIELDAELLRWRSPW